jgi:plasmid stabilization system protein ParE
MAQLRVRFAQSALDDLNAILDWYEEQTVPEVGQRFVSEVFDRVESLVQHPDMGRVVPEFGQSFLRELIHPPFRIVYRRDPKVISVIRGWTSV